jgi:hypothetical protein
MNCFFTTEGTDCFTEDTKGCFATFLCRPALDLCLEKDPGVGARGDRPIMGGSLATFFYHRGHRLLHRGHSGYIALL